MILLIMGDLSQGGREAPWSEKDKGKAFSLEGDEHCIQETLGNQTEFNSKSVEFHVTLGHTNTNVLCKVVHRTKTLVSS